MPSGVQALACASRRSIAKIRFRSGSTLIDGTSDSSAPCSVLPVNLYSASVTHVSRAGRGPTGFVAATGDKQDRQDRLFHVANSVAPQRTGSPVSRPVPIGLDVKLAHALADVACELG